MAEDKDPLSKKDIAEDKKSRSKKDMAKDKEPPSKKDMEGQKSCQELLIWSNQFDNRYAIDVALILVTSWKGMQ